MKSIIRSRARAVLSIAMVLTLATPSAAVHVPESPAEILARADAIRNPQQSFVVDVNLISYEGGRETGRTIVTTHSRKESGTGQFQSLVHIDRPARDSGKLILRNGNILWFFDPASKASVRLSPRQRLAGNASNGDVITANFSLDYDVTLTAEEQVMDGDRNKRDTYRLHLVSRNEITPYGRIDFWVSKDNYRPIKGRFYSKSGKPLKVAWYRGWTEVMGSARPTEVVIADGFDRNSVTLMQLTNYRPRALPAAWFNKNWLPRFRKQ